MTTTLLAVDDSKTMRKVLEITFAGEDFKTIVAANAAEAMQHLGAHKPSIVLVDHDLGGASGYELCKQIKGTAPDTRVIVLSSKQAPYDKSKGTAAGADDFMDKPFDTQKLLDKVGAVLSQPAATAAAAAPAPSPAAGAAMPRPGGLAARPAAAPASVGARPRSPVATPGPAIASPRPSPGFQRPAASPVARPVAAAQPARPAPPAQPASPPAPAAATVAAATSGNGPLAAKLEGIGLSPDQVNAVLSLSREVVEQVVWEVVPVLAETLIKEEILRLTSE